MKNKQKIITEDKNVTLKLNLGLSGMVSIVRYYKNIEDSDIIVLSKDEVKDVIETLDEWVKQ